jgi:hypothetical protein
VTAEESYIAAVRGWAAEHHVPETAVQRWLQLGQRDAMAILAVAKQLRLRTGQLISALEMLAEISVREGEGAAGILARDAVRSTLARGGSRPERASAFIDKLRELRYPRLAQTRSQLQAAVASMRLPPGVAVVLPKDLASDELIIRLTVHSATELDQLLAALPQRQDQIKTLIQMLGGAGQI